MHFSPLVLLATALSFTAILAAPLAAPLASEISLEKRDGFVLEYYADPDFKGNFLRIRIFQQSIGSCMAVLFDDRISSYKVYGGACTFYRNPNCNDALFTARDREDRSIGNGNNDQTSSVRCVY